MGSFVITGARWRSRPEEAERHGPYERVYLAEGDSWMDASGGAQGSLPFYLVQECQRRGRSVLIINISTSGQTLQRITDMMNGDWVWWLRQQRYDGVLFSAGGNDFIDAARDPDPGQGLLRDLAGQPLPADGHDAVSAAARDRLVNSYLAPNFAAMHAALRASALNAATPMFVNEYETPVARNAPAIAGLLGPWLHTAYLKNHIDPVLWPSLTRGLFDDLAQAVGGWAARHDGVHPVPITHALTPADPASGDSSGDWLNEIHPNGGGWAKLARVWADTLGL